jgi:hypothetical protein
MHTPHDFRREELTETELSARVARIQAVFDSTQELVNLNVARLDSNRTLLADVTDGIRAQLAGQSDLTSKIDEANRSTAETKQQIKEAKVVGLNALAALASLGVSYAIRTCVPSPPSAPQRGLDVSPLRRGGGILVQNSSESVRDNGGFVRYCSFEPDGNRETNDSGMEGNNRDNDRDWSRDLRWAEAERLREMARVYDRGAAEHMDEAIVNLNPKNEFRPYAGLDEASRACSDKQEAQRLYGEANRLENSIAQDASNQAIEKAYEGTRDGGCVIA